MHLLRYIGYNKTLVLKYYSDMKDAPLSDILRQAIIKNENQFMAFPDYSWQDCPDTGRSTGAYIIFIKVVQLTMKHMFQDKLLNQVQ